MSDRPNGIMANTGLISGNSALHTTSAHAEATIDIRVRSVARAPGGINADLTAAMGVPSADGLGSKGPNPHVEGENIEIGEQANRLALFMKEINSL